MLATLSRTYTCTCRLQEGGTDLACTGLLDKMLVADQILAQQHVQQMIICFPCNAGLCSCAAGMAKMQHSGAA